MRKDRNRRFTEGKAGKQAWGRCSDSGVTRAEHEERRSLGPLVCRRVRKNPLGECAGRPVCPFAVQGLSLLPISGFQREVTESGAGVSHPFW